MPRAKTYSPNIMGAEQITLLFSFLCNLLQSTCCLMSELWAMCFWSYPPQIIMLVAVALLLHTLSGLTASLMVEVRIDKLLFWYCTTLHHNLNISLYLLLIEHERWNGCSDADIKTHIVSISYYWRSPHTNTNSVKYHCKLLGERS